MYSSIRRGRRILHTPSTHTNVGEPPAAPPPSCSRLRVLLALAAAAAVLLYLLDRLVVRDAGGAANLAASFVRALAPRCRPANATRAPGGVSICLLYGGDARALREWLVFHRAQGVRHVDVA